MNKNIRHIFFLVLIAWIISCKKKTPEDIGLPYLPSGDLLHADFTDTFTLITHTVKGSPQAPLQMNRQNPNLLGAMNDPLFGTTTASIFTQYDPSINYPSFGYPWTITLDSVVLSLPYYNNGGKYYYGALAAEKFAVYEITDPAFNWDSSYYSTRSILYSTLLADTSIKPAANLNDSVRIGTGTSKYTLPPQLRIKLNKIYFQNFFDSTKYATPATFQSIFKGLYITTTSIPSSPPGAILYIDLANTLYSQLTLYFTSSIKAASSGPLGMDTSITFIVNGGDCAHYSRVIHDYTNAADLNNQIIDKDTMHQEKDVYVQPLNGVMTKITLPFLKHFFDDGKKSINKAELILNVEPSSVSSSNYLLPFPPQTQLMAMLADSVPLLLPDYSEGAAYFGGTYDSINHQYIFNIARYVQQILDGKLKDEGLYITPTSYYTIANRVQIVGGDKSLNGHMRLKLTYTPLISTRSKPPVKQIPKTIVQPVQLNQKQ